MGRRRKNKKRKSLFKNKNSQINTCETKNIPKNYGKQIIKFIKTEKELTKQALESNKSKFSYE
jgi:hypothetical protein